LTEIQKSIAIFSIFWYNETEHSENPGEFNVYRAVGRTGGKICKKGYFI